MWCKTCRFPEILLPFQTRTHLCTRGIESVERCETVGLYLACHSRCLPEHRGTFSTFYLFRNVYLAIYLPPSLSICIYSSVSIN